MAEFVELRSSFLRRRFCDTAKLLLIMPRNKSDVKARQNVLCSTTEADEIVRRVAFKLVASDAAYAAAAIRTSKQQKLIEANLVYTREGK